MSLKVIVKKVCDPHYQTHYFALLSNLDISSLETCINGLHAEHFHETSFHFHSLSKTSKSRGADREKFIKETLVSKRI